MKGGGEEHTYREYNEHTALPKPIKQSPIIIYARITPTRCEISTFDHSKNLHNELRSQDCQKIVKIKFLRHDKIKLETQK